MPLERPTLKQLEYLISIAETGTFRGAAEQLGVSQPALSSQIYNLEQCLQIPLLERSRSGAVLTPAGRELLPNARQVMEEMRGLIDHAGMIQHGPGGTFRMGVSPTVGPYLLPHILPAVHRKYASLKLYVRENMPAALTTDLMEGRLDLILIPLPFGGAAFTTEVLFQEPMRLVIPSDHRLATRQRISGNDLKGENILTLEPQYSSFHPIQEVCQNLGANILRDYEGTSLDALRQMVVMGMGLAFLPALYIHTDIAQSESLLVTDVPQLNLTRTHVLAWRQRSPNRGFYRQLAQTIRELVRENLAEASLSIA